jgi:hypothetical protein
MLARIAGFVLSARLPGAAPTRNGDDWHDSGNALVAGLMDDERLQRPLLRCETLDFFFRACHVKKPLATTASPGAQHEKQPTPIRPTSAPSLNDSCPRLVEHVALDGACLYAHNGLPRIRSGRRQRISLLHLPPPWMCQPHTVDIDKCLLAISRAPG